MKSVLIIGAGPAGLVAAKTLLCNKPGTFKVTIFEASDRIGGMWRAWKGEEGIKCHPWMRTNLSRFTVAFSDFSWNSVDLADDNNEHLQPASPPMFPHAWQVGRYLEAYAENFIPDDIIYCSRAVKRVELTEGTPRTWRVSSFDKISETTVIDEFDYLLIASGFYDQPESVSMSSGPGGVKVKHSSQFRDISTLARKAGNVVVIGGGISGSEAAATAAFQISSAKYSPDSPKPPSADCKVYHIFNRPFYCLPRYLPQEPYNPAIQDYKLAPTFLPIDLTLYNLTRRAVDGPISAPIGPVPPEKARSGHRFLRNITGDDQRDVGYREIVYDSEQQQFPAFNGITDTYTEFVRSGAIIPVRGRGNLVLNEGKGHKIEVAVDRREGPWDFKYEDVHTRVIEDVVAVIEATGFKSNLDYLIPSVKRALEYDPTCKQVPILLSHGSVFNPAVPELAYVGFYQGPFWGVMEMQARFVANEWSKSMRDKLVDLLDISPEAFEAAPGNNYSEKLWNLENQRSPFCSDVREMRKMREAIVSGANNIAQFWMGDVVGLVEEFAREMGIQRLDSRFGGQKGPCVAARYAGSVEDAAEIIEEVATVLDDSETKSRFVAAAVFRAMQGTWELQRKIDSRASAAPGGTLKGTAQFHPRFPTAPEFSAEYLYIEEGIFTMDNGYSFPATRRYVYRYNEVKDKISAWFVQEDGETVEKFFNQLEFKGAEDEGKGWVAVGSHWCDPDTYKSSSEFRFRGAALERFGIMYDVSGPRKDYTMESWYQRPAPTA
ncbi:hypothetical protein BCR34DRAFT_326139 [Clohesyomyces aquaticus]|uniref:Uncharacterized protein n=1 Tax=Clohesyomyces aquaticus TaxID=1231657 RepID=A0A1Y1ZMD1_9PLEO|nr:hypothetical protein BCR34DRAFT_326139 [Clohesyomyces aquaticus]